MPHPTRKVLRVVQTSRGFRQVQLRSKMTCSWPVFPARWIQRSRVQERGGEFYEHNVPLGTSILDGCPGTRYGGVRIDRGPDRCGGCRISSADRGTGSEHDFLEGAIQFRRNKLAARPLNRRFEQQSRGHRPPALFSFLDRVYVSRRQAVRLRIRSGTLAAVG